MLNVVVVGGGLGGLSTAIALASSTARVVLLEADEEFSEVSLYRQRFFPPFSSFFFPPFLRKRNWT